MKTLATIITIAISTIILSTTTYAANVPDGYDGSNPPRLQCTNEPVTPGVPESYVGTYCQCPFYENAMHPKGCVPPPDIKCNADWSYCEYIGTSWTPEPAPKKPVSEPKAENRTNTHTAPKSAPATPESTNTTYFEAPIDSNVNEKAKSVDVDEPKVNKTAQIDYVDPKEKQLDEDIEKTENGVKSVLIGMSGFFAVALSAVGLIARFVIFKS